MNVTETSATDILNGIIQTLDRHVPSMLPTSRFGLVRSFCRSCHWMVCVLSWREHLHISTDVTWDLNKPFLLTGGASTISFGEASHILIQKKIIPQKNTMDPKRHTLQNNFSGPLRKNPRTLEISSFFFLGRVWNLTPTPPKKKKQKQKH